MANLLSNSMPHKVHFYADGFNNLPIFDYCAQRRNITPYASNCTNVYPYHDSPLHCIGTAKVPQMGHIHWKIYDDKGNKTIINDPNGVTECIIKDLSDSTRAMLVKAKHHNP